MQLLDPNSAVFKRVLALLRDGEYAHAGEEEAIHRVLDPIRKRPEQRLLDTGCGLGGTAAFVQAHGWGRVVGIDIDDATIAHARSHHPEVEFHVSDVVRADRVVAPPVDVVYAFNAVYAFPDQGAALAALRRCCVGGGELAIFDYVDLSDGGWSMPAIPFPLRRQRCRELLTAAGWRPTSWEDISVDYERWYTELCSRISARREAIHALGGDAAV